MSEHRRRLHDVWLVVITVVVVLVAWKTLDTANQTGRFQRSDTLALCAFRADLQQRVTSGEAFLKTHPQGILGIPAPTIRASLNNQEATLRTLAPLICPVSETGAR
jgi:hypothetical protein